MTDPVAVAVDANGADHGPAEVARGAAAAASEHGVRVLLFGPAAQIGDVPEGVEVVDAPVSIAKAEDPARAVRANPDASIVAAVAAVADGRADALVSGGSTGTALAASLFRIKRGRGIHRPALAVLVPVPGSPFLLLDAGANVEVRPEHLVQFAHMGAAFMETAMGVSRPRVALLSNGEEPSKGPEDLVAAHAVLSDADSRLNFVGNVEGFAIGTGEADVIVTDGFTGNVALKVMEGTSSVLLSAVRSAAESSARSKAGGLLLQAGAARAARPARPAGGRRRGAARPAQARGRPARVVRGGGHHDGDRARRARRARGRRGADARDAGGRRGAAARSRRGVRRGL